MIMNTRSWNVWSSGVVARRGHQEDEHEICNYRRFRGRPNRISAKCLCARSVQQDARALDAGPGIQERQPGCIGLRTGT